MEEKKIKEQQNNKKKNKVVKAVALLGLFLMVFGISYALFSVVLNGTKKNKITTGRLSLELVNEKGNTIDDNTIGVEDMLPMTDVEGLNLQEYSFTLRNNGTIDATYTIYLDDDEIEVGEERMDDSNIRYALTKEDSAPLVDDLTNIGENPTRDLDRGQIKVGEEINYTLRMWVKEDAGNDAMGKVLSTKLRIEGTQQVQNPNVVSVYEYNETGSNLCITGEEATCVETKCLTSKGNCPAGTIVQYRVNNKETKYLYVLHDDGETLTLQDRENTVKEVSWNNTSTVEKGPTEALDKIEEATSTWLGVETLNYTPGVTDFTGLGTTFITHEIKEPQGIEDMSEEEMMDWMMNNYDSYIKDINNYEGSIGYTMDARHGKARMILDIEVNLLQQLDKETFDTNIPIFMYNYLASSINFGGTVNSNENGYWTMSTYHGYATNEYAYVVQAYGGSPNLGLIPQSIRYSSNMGARAVVVVRK